MGVSQWSTDQSFSLQTAALGSATDLLSDQNLF